MASNTRTKAACAGRGSLPQLPGRTGQIIRVARCGWYSAGILYIGKPFRILSGEPRLEVLIAEPADHFAAAAGMAQSDVRQRHPVESVVLDHGIDRHIAKDKAVPHLRAGVEAVFAND